MLQGSDILYSSASSSHPVFLSMWQVVSHVDALILLANGVVMQLLREFLWMPLKGLSCLTYFL